MGRLIEHGLSRRIVNGRNVAHIEKKFDRPNHKTYGEIPGVINGKWWATRLEASKDGCHVSTVAGISGKGCWLIVLSGGYEDDVDDGYCFTYTGYRGRNLKRDERKSQEPPHCTAILRPNAYRSKSCTEYILRQCKSDQSNSRLQRPLRAPSEGHRYLAPRRTSDL